MVAFMSQSRKKFNPKSSSQKTKATTGSNQSSSDYIQKLDTLRSNAKQEQKGIVYNDNQKPKLIAAGLIIAVVMSGIVIISILPPGTIPILQGSNNGKNIVGSIGGFSEDTLGLVSKTGTKITFVYVGGEFCPYCAMERWAIVMALSHFGNFSGLGTIVSAESSVPTYTFYSSYTYTSNVVDFEPVEVYDNVYNSNTQSYGSLETPNTLQQNEMNKYGSGSIPFICIGGIYFRSGAGSSLSIGTFSGQTFSSIQSQVTSKSGTAYNQINTDSNYLISIINKLLSPPTSTVSTTTTTTA